MHVAVDAEHTDDHVLIFDKISAGGEASALAAPGIIGQIRLIAVGIAGDELPRKVREGTADSSPG